jgi:hypothetical protein
MTQPPHDWPYGSQRKPAAPDGFWITSDDLFSAMGEWAEPLSWLRGMVPLGWVWTDEMCARIPQPDEEITGDELLTAIAMPFGMPDLVRKLRIAAENAVWPTYCELSPAPDPVEEPTPPPPEWVPPDPPPVEFEPEPVQSTTLDQIGVLLSWVFRALGEVQNVVEYNQELLLHLAENHQSLRFIPGDSIEVTGNGSAFLAPADGYMVVLTTIPNWVGRSPGPMPTYFDAGFFGFGPFGTTRRMERLSRQTNLFYPTGIEPEHVQWELPAGVQAIITALLRQPYPGAPTRTWSLPGG